VYDGKLWVIAGSYFDGTYVALSDVWHSSNGVDWVESTDSVPWSNLAVHAAVVYEDKIWVMGGWAQGSLSSDVWTYEKTVGWTHITGAAPWGPRWHHDAVVFDGKIWLFGGASSTPDWNEKNDVWCYDKVAGWQEVTSLAPWLPRGDHKVAVVQGKIYLAFGATYKSGAWTEFNDVWSYDTVSGWARLASPAPWEPRADATLTSLKDNLYVVGGGSVDETGFHMFNDAWRSGPGLFSGFNVSGTLAESPFNAQFTDTSASWGMPIQSWAWDFGDGNTSDQQSPAHTYWDTGIYTVSLTVSNGAGSDTKTKRDLITVAEKVPCLGNIGIIFVALCLTALGSLALRNRLKV
jgi:hypothetical protein